MRRTIALDGTYSVGSNLSGVGVYSRELLRALAASHPETRFLHQFRPHRFLKAFEERRPANVSRSLLLPPLLPARGDLFHGLNQRLPEGRLPLAITTFHDLFVLTGDYSTAEFRTRFSEQARDAARRSDLVLAVSSFTAGQVADLLNFDRRRVRVIPHGVRFPESIADTSREPVILHVGAIQKRKNILRLVEAFERAAPSPWRLVLAGSAGYGADVILERIERSPARDRIQMTGWIDDSSLASLYLRARLLAFPSLDEGFGIPALEAMALGLPVMASDRSALPEVCGDAALLINPDDVDAMVLALRRMIEDGGLREQLAACGRTRARLFTWENTAALTWAAYAELL